MKFLHLLSLAVFLFLGVATASIAMASALSPTGGSGTPDESVPGEILFQLTEVAFSSGDYRADLGLSGRTGIAALDQVLVTLDANRIDPAFDLGTNAAAKSAEGLDRIFLVTFDPAIASVQAANTMDQLSSIEYAEPNGLWHAMLAPNDFYYDDQWAHDNNGQAISYDGDPVGTSDCDTDTDLAWDYQTGDPNLIIAVIDTGCDLNHPEYSSRLVAGYDFVNNDSNPSDDGDHGTACAGIALAAGNNNQGVAGVAWNVKLMPIKVLDSGGSGSWGDVADGIEFGCDNGARILSLSLGGGSSNTVRNAVNYAFGEGCALFAATGNGNSSSLSYPARYDNAIAVGAMSPCCERKNPDSCDGEFWWGSNYGTGIDFLAPGTRIHTTDRLGNQGYENGDYLSYFNGTSAATPHAAGIGALVWSEDPSLTNDELRTVLQNTCDDIGSSGYDSQTGYGRLNAHQAVLAVLGEEDGACCYPDGTCDVVLESNCSGDWQGGGTVCSPNPCPQPVGACCAPDGTCTVTEESACSDSWQGAGTDCSPNPCPQPVGACCFADGHCESLLEADCAPGDWTMFAECAPNPCPQPVGACCFADGHCETLLEADCATGDWTMFAECDPNPCPQPVGACCAPDGTCTVTEESACSDSWQGAGTDCAPNPCPQPVGACCFADGHCETLLEADCATGDWTMFAECDPNPCPQPVGACCFADGHCESLLEADCATGDWTMFAECDPNPCPQPVGACCFADGHCESLLEADCATGDWRVFEPCDPNPCPQPVGACCFADGHCESLLEADCATGDWRVFEPCDPNPCDQPVGACCAADGTCTMTEESKCSGSWQGIDTVCDPNPCPQPAGACCFSDGHCESLLEADCESGEWTMFGECDPNPCDQPSGACCYADGTCAVNLEADCESGEWTMFAECDPNPCDQPSGSCCYADGTCAVNLEAECESGEWTMFGECDPNPCPQPAAACCTDEVCEILTEAECADQGGDWYSDEGTCDTDPCPVSSTPEDPAELPTALKFYNSSPNPFRDATTIRFDLPEAARVTIRVYDIAGNVVRTISDRVVSAGTHGMTWDGTDDQDREVGSGVYYYVFETGGLRETRSVVRMK